MPAMIESPADLLYWCAAQLRKPCMGYCQVRYVLESGEGYCALGKIWLENMFEYGNFFEMESEWAEKFGYEFSSTLAKSIVHMNDTQQFSYDEIADRLHEHAERLEEYASIRQRKASVVKRSDPIRTYTLEAYPSDA